jgi:acyl dehydratase
MIASVPAAPKVGDELPGFTAPALTRHALALYCGASGDHNPIHVDIDFARDVAGLDDVIGHGMLTMAYLGRVLTDWVPQTWIRRFSTRFLLPTKVGDRIQCSGRVVESSGGPEPVFTVELRAIRQDGALLANGSAEVVWRS